MNAMKLIAKLMSGLWRAFLRDRLRAELPVATFAHRQLEALWESWGPTERSAPRLPPDGEDRGPQSTPFLVIRTDFCVSY